MRADTASAPVSAHMSDRPGLTQTHRARHPAQHVVAPPASGRARLRGAVRGAWASLDAPANTRVPGTLVIAGFTAIVAIIAAWYSVSTGLALAYADSLSHLTIARRLVDSMSPGFRQLGTVWLPAPHIVLMPWTLWTWAWRTGVAGAIVGSGCLVATTSALYRIAARLGLRRIGRLGVVAVFLLNPSILYLFTTALTEPVLIAGIAGSLAGLARWATSSRRLSGGEVAVFAGIPATIAVLSRYEGWAYVLAGVLLIVLVERQRATPRRRMWGPLIGFVAVPAVGVAWWLIYNAITYGDPLAFARGPYSAFALQEHLLTEGMAPTAGNLGLSLSTYSWALWLTAGPIVVAVGVFGMGVLALREGLSTRTLIIGVAASTYVFSVVSLTAGQSIMYVEQTVPHQVWNTRFAASTMIFLALVCGVALEWGPWGRSPQWRRVAAAVALVGLAGQTVWWAQAPWQRSAVLAEVRSQLQGTAPGREAAEWFRQNWEGGDVLIDETSGGYGIMPLLGVPLKDVYMQSSGDAYATALADPARYAQWIVVTTDALTGPVAGNASTSSDEVADRVRNDPVIAARYSVVFSNSARTIFERIGDGR